MGITQCGVAQEHDYRFKLTTFAADDRTSSIEIFQVDGLPQTDQCETCAGSSLKTQDGERVPVIILEDIGWFR